MDSKIHIHKMNIYTFMEITLGGFSNDIPEKKIAGIPESIVNRILELRSQGISWSDIDSRFDRVFNIKSLQVRLTQRKVFRRNFANWSLEELAKLKRLCANRDNTYTWILGQFPGRSKFSVSTALYTRGFRGSTARQRASPSHSDPQSPDPSSANPTLMT